MVQKKVIVSRNGIEFDGNSILPNFWNGFLSKMMQIIVSEEENGLVALVGEENFEELYDEIESFSEAILDLNNRESKLSENLKSFEDMLFIVNKGAEKACVNVFSRSHIINVTDVSRWIDDYFKEILLPYIRIEKSDKLLVDSEDKELMCFFKIQLVKNGWDCVEEKADKNQIYDISLIKEVNSFIQWCEEEDCLYIKNNVCGYIPISINIQDINKRTFARNVNIYFPFYNVGDMVSVQFEKKEVIWQIVAKNISSNIQFIGEIAL